MGEKLSAFARDARGAISVDHLVAVAAVIALVVAIAGGIKTGAFAAISEVINDPASQSGCVTTGKLGSTDLSNCQ